MSTTALTGGCALYPTARCAALPGRWVAYGCQALHVASCRACQPCCETISTLLLGRPCGHALLRGNVLGRCDLPVTEACILDDAGIETWASLWDCAPRPMSGLLGYLDGSYPVRSVASVSQVVPPVLGTSPVLAPASTGEAKTRGFIKLQQAVRGRKYRKW